MRYNEIEVLDDGSLELRCLPPFFADFLLQLPGILAGGSPFLGDEERRDVAGFLYPPVFEEGDTEAAADWERYGRPDLLALFADRQDILTRDLRGLDPYFVVVPSLVRAVHGEGDVEIEDDAEDEDPGGLPDFPAFEDEPEDPGEDMLPSPFPLFRVRIPAAHRTAWLSSLNGARLLLAERFGFLDEGMMPPPTVVGPDPAAVARLMIYAYEEIEHLMVEVEDGFLEDGGDE